MLNKRKEMKFNRFASLFLFSMIVLFIIIVFSFNQYQKTRFLQDMARHSKVITDDVWAINYPGVMVYLELVAELENYAGIELKDDFNKTILTVSRPELTGLDKLLEQAGLIPKIPLTVTVEHDGQVIGTLIARHRNMAVYTHAYLFLLLVFFYAAIVQYVKVLQVKKGLEGHVRQRTEELNESNRRLSRNIRILDQAQKIAHIGHFDFNVDNRKILWSDEVYRIVQKDPYSFKPTYENYLATIHPEDRPFVENEYYQSINEKTNFDFEVRVLLDDGTVKYIQNIGYTECDETGRPTHTVGMVLDITSWKQAEKEKVEAQKHAAEQEKMAFLGTIAGRLAHDFNNILGVILGNAELALMECDEGGIKKNLKIIFEQTIRGKNLTRNLVIFARDQEPKQTFFKLTEKIDLVLNLMKKDLDGIDVIREYKSEVPDLLADSGMIEHTLVNLVQNAIHALSRAENPKIYMRVFADSDSIVFEIEDNGCGIPEDYHKSIYNPTFTLKGNKDVSGSYERDIKGTGYGMANVKKYVEMHRGEIRVDSKPDVGTIFTIIFPIVKKELTLEEIDEIRMEISHVGKRILLVEDEKDISDVQYKVLTNEPCNHRVDVANNGNIAIELFDANHYDFISLDYVLMGETTGMEVYHHIRTRDKTIPILFISGNIEFLKSIKELKQKDSNIDHLSKPCQNREYVNEINSLLNRAVSPRPSP